MCYMDLESICTARMAILSQTDWEGRNWVSVAPQLVIVSGGLHHLAAELVPQHHLLTTTSCSIQQTFSQP